jgi:hypothetical protein
MSIFALILRHLRIEIKNLVVVVKGFRQQIILLTTDLNRLGETFRQPDILNEHVKLKIKVGKVYYKIP